MYVGIDGPFDQSSAVADPRGGLKGACAHPPFSDFFFFFYKSEVY